MKMIVFFFVLFGIGVPLVATLQSSFGNGTQSFDENTKRDGFGCLGNLLGLFGVLVLFAVAAAICRVF